MKKKKNPISLNMALLGTTWKLRFFISFLLIFISTSLCASENPSSETIVHDEPSVESSQPTKPIVYIAEGTAVYGMENMSQNASSNLSKKKKSDKNIAPKKVKSISITKKIAQKIKIEREIQKPEATTHISSHQSENSFEVSKQRYGVGTLTLNHYFKSAIVKNIVKIPSPPANNTNSSYQNGISSSNAQEKLSFSTSENNSEIEVTDSSVKVKKDGIYRFTFNTNLNATERKQKDISYYVSLNGKEVFNKNQRNIPASGEYYFQIQLKANDLIAFNIKGNEEVSKDRLQNTLKIQFTDPKLIKAEENH